MSDSTLPLPARPSLEQLRKQAKEKLHQLRAADPAMTLARAQFVLAREYGFESWSRLVHHVASLLTADRVEQFDHLSQQLAAALGGDEAAMQWLNELFGGSYTVSQLRERYQERMGALTSAGGTPLDRARLFVAREFGFESWATLVGRIAQPAPDAASARLGLSATPPFYRIDDGRTIELRAPMSNRDWDVAIGVMKELDITGIRAGGVMTDEALARLADLPQLTQVNLDGNQRVTDDGLLHLARMPRLRELDVSGWHSQITDRGLEVLQRLPALTRFAMCWPQRVTDAGAAHLAACDRLERVNLLGTHTGDGAIAALAGKGRLHSLTTGRLVTDAGLLNLHDLPVFAGDDAGEVALDLMTFSPDRHALLVDGPITGDGLAALEGLEGLAGLSFFWHTSRLEGRDLAPLANLAHLQFVGCPDAICDDAAMRHLASMPRLRMLQGQGAVATDEGFAALSRSRSLEYIWGRECPNLTGRGLAALAGLPALRGLGVSCRNVDDAGLSALPRFPSLSQLMPMDVSDAGFRHVGECRRLEKLWCMYCRDTGDAATAHVARLPHLKTYYAGKTLITDRSLEMLARMTTLERVELWQVAGVTDAGLAALAALPNLREVVIDGLSNVTRGGAAAFPPAVRVRFAL